jgi:hypothetical protein
MFSFVRGLFQRTQSMKERMSLTDGHSQDDLHAGGWHGGVGRGEWLEEEEEEAEEEEERRLFFLSPGGGSGTDDDLPLMSLLRRLQPGWQGARGKRAPLPATSTH